MLRAYDYNNILILPGVQYAGGGVKVNAMWRSYIIIQIYSGAVKLRDDSNAHWKY